MLNNPLVMHQGTSFLSIRDWLSLEDRANLIMDRHHSSGVIEKIILLLVGFVSLPRTADSRADHPVFLDDTDGRIVANSALDGVHHFHRLRAVVQTRSA
jgi:hypothetical protein